MIDLEKLRELAEDDVKRGRQWSTNSRDVLMLLDHIVQLQDEVKEQCRVNGMGAEREAALLSKVAALEKDAGRLDFMQEEALDARCVEIGEDSYGWQIMSHFMSEPKLRMVGESHDELGLRAAIDTAMEASNG